MARIRLAGTGAAAACLTLAAACAGPAEEQPEGDGDSGAVATHSGDRAVYESVGDLAEQAQYAVVVDVGDGEGVWEYPDYDSDDPRVNPYAGTGWTPSPEQVHSGRLPVTRFEVDVVEVARGGSPAAAPISVGAGIVVQQRGGTVEGDTHVVEGVTPLRPGDRVLLFVRESPIDPGVYTILGGPAGTFWPSDGGFVSDLGLTLLDEQLQELLSTT